MILFLEDLIMVIVVVYFELYNSNYQCIVFNIMNLSSVILLCFVHLLDSLLVFMDFELGDQQVTEVIVVIYRSY